jgi:hypothetical protein
MQQEPRPRLPASHAPGVERVLLRKLPWILLFGTLLPALWAFGAHQLVDIPDARERAKYLLGIDIHAIALATLVWMGALTTAIGCGFVMVMKGEPHTADSYPIPGDEQRPARSERDEVS